MNDEIKSVLLHLGHNMWCDWIPPDIDSAELAKKFKEGASPVPDAVLRTNDALWRETTDYIAAKLAEAEGDELAQLRTEYAETIAQRRAWRTEINSL